MFKLRTTQEVHAGFELEIQSSTQRNRCSRFSSLWKAGKSLSASGGTVVSNLRLAGLCWESAPCTQPPGNESLYCLSLPVA